MHQAGTARRVIVVVGAKGGVGASMVTANLAALLASERQRLTAAVDLAGSDGELGALLGVGADVADEPRASGPSAPIDPEALLEATAVGVAGVHVLEWALPGPDTAEASGASHALVDGLRVLFDTSVVDMSRPAFGPVAAALTDIDHLVIVSAMSAPSARAARHALASLAAGATHAQVHLVLNRNEANTDLDRVDVEAIAGRPGTVHVPYDPAVVAPSVNRGSPFVLEHPDAQVSRKIRQLAASLGALAVARDV